MENKSSSRLKNYGLWLSIAAFIPMVLEVFGVEVVAEQYSALVNALLGILVAAGLLNNPTTSGKWFADDKEAVEELENK